MHWNTFLHHLKGHEHTFSVVYITLNLKKSACRLILWDIYTYVDSSGNLLRINGEWPIDNNNVSQHINIPFSQQRNFKTIESMRSKQIQIYNSKHFT